MAFRIIKGHQKPFLLNLADIRIIYSTPDWQGADQRFMNQVEAALSDGFGEHDIDHVYYAVNAPDYNPAKADPKLNPGRDLARQYAEDYGWDQKQLHQFNKKVRHGRKINISSANKKQIKSLPKLGDLIRKAQKN